MKVAGSIDELIFAPQLLPSQPAGLVSLGDIQALLLYPDELKKLTWLFETVLLVMV